MTARRRPPPVVAHALRRQVLGVFALVGAGLVSALLALGLGFGLSLSYYALALATYGAIGIAVFDGLRFLGGQRFGLANAVTLVRGAMVAVLAGFVVADAPALAWVAVALASIALALDGVDGWIARRQGMATAFGARFDMEIDALLIVVLAVLAALSGKAGPWILLAGLLRYLFVLAGLAVPALNAPLPPSFRRKLVCVVQILALIVILPPLLAPPVTSAIAAGALALLVYSFTVDTAWLLRHG
ncbi:CDP-alcohol phosphatidyltransferase family protein [Oleomonas cavernae]|uniref:CDP-alcohol phosphatidyltransferase family protein n=1 Tax=Oleomonas cavernae TaxID=2320859 RepID=A0A418WC87_9PROT|nr:CDP-alcohol phosphatidyltransferase family protein [Oleomonas cavernae]RJF87604.1 CDP-alcohol phosphatidyltransferase family protein [Oleomonas cavernae]